MRFPPYRRRSWSGFILRRKYDLRLHKICITIIQRVKGTADCRQCWPRFGTETWAPRPKPTSESWSQWQDVRPLSVSSRIVEQVRAALFRGELNPGDFLGSETDLARKLGVSRVPVRDAFKTLQALGIVEVKMGANGGARIAAGDPNRFADALAVQFKLVGISIEEMFDAQIAIEVMAAELGRQHATEADLQRLRDLLSSLQAMSQKSMTSIRGAALHDRLAQIFTRRWSMRRTIARCPLSSRHCDLCSNRSMRATPAMPSPSASLRHIRP